MDDTALRAIARVEGDGRNVAVHFAPSSSSCGGSGVHAVTEEYRGQLLHNLRHGDGTLALADGTLVAGSFAQGVLHGDVATVTRPDGAAYHGAVERGQRQGFGVFKRTGASYTGAWASGKRSGRVRVAPVLAIAATGDVMW
jgi:hypothetical protein